MSKPLLSWLPSVLLSASSSLVKKYVSSLKAHRCRLASCCARTRWIVFTLLYFGLVSLSIFAAVAVVDAKAPYFVGGGGTWSLSLITRCLAERKGQVCADKWAALMQLRWVLEASEHYTWNQGIYGSADRNLERIRLLFGNLLSFAWRWSVGLVTSLHFVYSGWYLW